MVVTAVKQSLNEGRGDRESLPVDLETDLIL